MKLSTNQLERLADRVFKVLKASGHVEIDLVEGVEDRIIDSILNVLEDDTRQEERLSRDAERLVSQHTEVAQRSGKSLEELVSEVRTRLAKSKKVHLEDGPERADLIGEKILKMLWKIDGIDFYVDDKRMQNCIARAIYRFRIEDDRLVDAVEKIVSKKSEEVPYSPKWCSSYDKYFNEVKEKVATANANKQPYSMPPTTVPPTE